MSSPQAGVRNRKTVFACGHNPRFNAIARSERHRKIGEIGRVPMFDWLYFTPQQSRHPERSASQIYRKQRG
jgi:hypothetical protein